MPKTAKCRWHKCQKEFEQKRITQKFCSDACAQARAQWRAARGSVLVDPLLTGDAATLEQHRRNIQDEIDGNPKT